MLAPLAEMTREGIGDVEVHIHHDNETPAGFIEKMSTFCRISAKITVCCMTTTDERSSGSSMETGHWIIRGPMGDGAA